MSEISVVIVALIILFIFMLKVLPEDKAAKLAELLFTILQALIKSPGGIKSLFKL